LLDLQKLDSDRRKDFLKKLVELLTISHSTGISSIEWSDRDAVRRLTNRIKEIVKDHNSREALICLIRFSVCYLPTQDLPELGAVIGVTKTPTIAKALR
jgi:hypothetical protein